MTDTPTRLTAEQKTSWLANLRSGKFLQARGCLHETVTDAYCCLGVLAETIAPGTVKGDPDDRWGVVIGADSNMFYDGLPLAPRIQQQCASFNDTEGKSFSEIADWVEANAPVRA